MFITNKKINFDSWEKTNNSKQNNSPKEKIELNFENTESVPEQIQKMIKAYRYDLAGSVRREQNFYLQRQINGYL